jgi:hypothetical protein
VWLSGIWAGLAATPLLDEPKEIGKGEVGGVERTYAYALLLQVMPFTPVRDY